MKQGISIKQDKNTLVFEAPKELADKTKEIAVLEMVSLSAICRKALNNYIMNAERKNLPENYASY
jgi:hypothetical protein